MNQSHQSKPCHNCDGDQPLDPQVAFNRLAAGYQQLADMVMTYMSEAGLDRKTRAQNASALVSRIERIVGGSLVPVGEFPECCLVGRRATDGTLRWSCTGVLIHPRIVLTAAHCQKGSAPINLVALNVENQSQLARAELIPVQRVYVHPDYPSTRLNDMAVLILQSDAVSAKPVALVKPAELNAANEVTLVGFGNDDLNSTRGFGIKRQVTVGITAIRRAPSDNLDQEELRLGFESDLEFTAGGGGYDTCNGDSGGPAYVMVGRQRKVAGLTSRPTYGYTNPCGEGGVYTRVDVQTDFIRDVAASHGITLRKDGTNARSEDATSLLAIYLRLEKLIADIKNISVADIKADDSLVNDLGFNVTGLIALLAPLNQTFADLGVNLVQDDLVDVDTVRDLAKLIQSKIPTTV